MQRRLTHRARAGAICGLFITIAVSASTFGTQGVQQGVAMTIVLLLTVIACVAFVQYVTRAPHSTGGDS